MQSENPTLPNVSVNSEVANTATLTENNKNNIEPQPLDTKSRKIQKKRDKYKKIDDEVRLQLLDAVHKKGEMLKTAAKRLNVNYSSAKSIFYTYRKEGRIIKKAIKSRSSSKPSVQPVANVSHQTREENVDNSWSSRWVGNAGSLLETFSRPFYGNWTNSTSAQNNSINMSATLDKNAYCANGWNIDYFGISNALRQQLGSLISLTPANEGLASNMGASIQDKQQNYNPLANIGLLQQLPFQNIFSAIRNPIPSLYSLVGQNNLPPQTPTPNTEHLSTTKE